LSNPDAVTQILLTTGQSAPTIAYDNSGIGGNGTPASSLTFSYTTNSNTNGLVIVSVDEATTSPSCTSDKVTGVTNNGTSLTDLGYYAKDSNGLAIKTYYGFAPATSTHNIVVSASASCIRYAAAATYTGVKQSGMPDASGSGNPLNTSGLVSLLQATTSASYNAWAVLIGVPSTAGTATAGPGTTIRQQQSGEIYYADSNGPVYGATGLSWTKGANADWAANYFSIAPLTSNPGTVATTSISYDPNGNVIQVGTTTFYTYDYANHLTQSDIRVGNATTTTTYAYGPFGNRVSQSAASTTFIYPNKFYSVASSTGTGANYATTTDYVYAGSNLLATIDQKIISGTASGTAITRYNHTDNLGSTNVTSDAMMNISQWFDYAPYGSVIATTNTGQTAAARGYIGQFADQSNLLYLNARYYNGAQGQFTSQDPTFLALGNPNQLQQMSQQDQQRFLSDPQQLNAYSYGRDNPITKKDPNGNQAVEAYKLLYEGIEWTNRGLYARDISGYVWNGMPSEQSAEINFGGAMFTGGLAAQYVPGMAGYLAPGLGLAEIGLTGLSYACSFTTCGPIGSVGMTPVQIQKQILSSVSPQIAVSGQGSGTLNFGSFNNLFSGSVQTRQAAAQSINTSTGNSTSGSGGGGSAPSNNSLWITPSGAVVTFGGQLVAPPPATH
jgi:RHS repeat-associated protein